MLHDLAVMFFGLVLAGGIATVIAIVVENLDKIRKALGL